MCTSQQEEEEKYFIIFCAFQQRRVIFGIIYPKVKIETTILSFDKKYI